MEDFCDNFRASIVICHCEEMHCIICQKKKKENNVNNWNLIGSLLSFTVENNLAQSYKSEK
jgi:hypothetical protein